MKSPRRFLTFYNTKHDYDNFWTAAAAENSIPLTVKNDRCQEESAARTAHRIPTVHLPNMFLVQPDGRRPLERPRRRWEDNIKMDLREFGWGGMDWINLAQDRDRWRALVNAVMNLRVP
jgi:hypothetical protein